MKTLYAVSASMLLATAAYAQGMSEQQMQQMMQGAMKAQECMSQIDQGAMQKMEKRSREMEAEIKTLCKAGKRDEAERKAIAFGKEIHGDPEMQKMQACASQMKQPTPGGHFPKDEHDPKVKRLCD